MPLKEIKTRVEKSTLLRAFELMATAKAMTELYEEKREISSKYVHATSRGHEATQLGMAFHLKPQDWLSLYYRDDSFLLGIGYTPFDLMLQLLGKKTDPFSGGRTYYSHPSSKRDDMPKIPHQSSATGMQAIPTTGIAHGLKYLESQGLMKYKGDDKPIVVCSLGDAAITEGEVAESFQMAVLKKLPIIYFIQDNDWDISATARETRAQDAIHYARGFKGLETISVNGSDFEECFVEFGKIVSLCRDERRPFLIHAKVPLLNHHTSGVRKEWYRPAADLAEHQSRDPYPLLKNILLDAGVSEKEMEAIENKTQKSVRADFDRAMKEPEPSVDDVETFVFAPTPITEEKGVRHPKNGEKVVMVDAALHAVEDILKKHPEALLYGQDVGGELGGVFREAALLAKKYGDARVFNTPIMEAYIVGSTVGMSAVGCKPIVEVQFADYIWPGLNQLFTEVARSNYLTVGKYPVQMVLRVPIGAYGSGGPYHSSSVESVLCNIKGIKIAYPSNTADMKGLMKAAFYDPNPVLMLEHKGLYWSKVPGTLDAKTIEPDADYIVPLGKGRVALAADELQLENGNTVCVITYGMGVYWSMNAAKNFPGQIEVIDLRSLVPLDEELIYSTVKKHGKVICLTEEALSNSFCEALAGKISSNCFEFLDAPVKCIGAKNVPAVPLNSVLEQAMLPSAEKVGKVMEELLNY